MLGYTSAHADQCGVKVAPCWGTLVLMLINVVLR